MNSTRVTILSLILLLASPTFVSAQAVKYTVQVEAVPAQATAEERVKQLRAQGAEAYWIKSDLPGKGVLYRVRIGRFPTMAAAKVYGEQLRRKGIIGAFYAAEYEGVPQTAVASEPKNQALSPVTPASADRPPQTREGSAETKTPKTVATTQPPVTAPQVVQATSQATAKETAKAAKNSVTASSPSGPAPGFTRYEDKAVGYSFDHPSYWTGTALSNAEAQAQRIDAGATFKSGQDAAFMNSIWNVLAEANSPTHDNNLVVDLIIKSMGSGAETQSLTETSRRVVKEGNQIKTFIDLRALFRDPRSPSPLEFLGKAAIIRASKGILMVAVFYAKDGPPSSASVADRIISSARVPE